MTDIKKTGKDKGGAKAKKLELKKDTLKDLRPTNSAGVKGGDTGPGGSQNWNQNCCAASM
jgi:hypothetical protein